MHIITQQRIWGAISQYPMASGSLENWYRFMKKNQFQGFSDMKRSFNSVDKVGDFYVFDIGGNKLRLITSIHFNRQKVYIRYVLTHREYEKGHWKQKGK